MSIRTEQYFFGSGTTIEAILRLKNPLVEIGPNLQELVNIFNELNQNVCTKAFSQYIIPIKEEYQLKETE